MADKRPTEVLGYRLDENLVPVREYTDLTRKGDYGCDPMGDGTFRMVPSGEIVTYDEMRRRLGR